MTMTTVNGSISIAQQILETIQDNAPLAKAISEGDTRILRAVPTFDKQSIMRTQAVAQVWRKIGRQVLAIHPEIVEETRLATSDKVPVEILRVLPYMNPLVVYSEPVVFPTWQTKKVIKETGEHSLRLMGFFTCGTSLEPVYEDGKKVSVKQNINTTNSTDATHFTVLAVFDVLDEYGAHMTTEFSTYSFDFTKIDSLAGIVEDSLQRFQWVDSGIALTPDERGEDEATQRRHRKYMKGIFSVIIGSLFYLCSTTLEAEQVPAKHVAKRIPKRIVRTPLSFYKVGWTMGGALTRYRQSRTNSTSEMTGIEHQQDPQHRRAHFKMQPYGPNCQMRKLIFVTAYWTHLERLGEGGINVARRVPRAVKDDARESLDTVLGMGALPIEVQ